MATLEPGLGIWQMVAQTPNTRQSEKKQWPLEAQLFIQCQRFALTIWILFWCGNSGPLMNVSVLERHLISSLYLGIRPYEINIVFGSYLNS